MGPSGSGPLLGSPVMESTPPGELAFALGALAAVVLTSWGSTFIVLLVACSFLVGAVSSSIAAAFQRAYGTPLW